MGCVWRVHSARNRGALRRCRAAGRGARRERFGAGRCPGRRAGSLRVSGRHDRGRGDVLSVSRSGLHQAATGHVLSLLRVPRAQRQLPDRHGPQALLHRQVRVAEQGGRGARRDEELVRGARRLPEQRQAPLQRQDEWTFACEGPERLPYPYGFTRDATACNIDKAAIQVDESALQRAERARRRGRSALAGRGQRLARRCKSPFGVYDMTGNVDEWTVNETASPTRARSRAATGAGSAVAAAPSPRTRRGLPLLPDRLPLLRQPGREHRRAARAPPPRSPDPDPTRPPRPDPDPDRARPDPSPRVAAPAPPPPPRVVDDRPRDVVRGPQKGALGIPANAAGHRVFVDGRVVPQSLGTVVVDCGAHTVRIGHDGRDQVIDVPCGGRISVAYP